MIVTKRNAKPPANGIDTMSMVPHDANMPERARTDDPGLEAFAALLRSRIPDYGVRGALEKFSERCGVPGPQIGRIARGVNRPTDKTLRRLALGMGISLQHARDVLDGMADLPEPPPPEDVYELQRLLDEAHRLATKLTLQHAQSMRASETRKPRSPSSKQTRMHTNMHYDCQSEFPVQVYQAPYKPPNFDHKGSVVRRSLATAAIPTLVCTHNSRLHWDEGSFRAAA